MASISGRFDYSQLQEFCNKLNANFSKQQCSEFVVNCTREIADRFLQIVKQRTPGGQLSAAWTTGEIEYNGVTCKINIVNNAVNDDGVPYAIYVEYGHRKRNGGWVTGHFMMTSTEDDLREKIPLILQQRLEEKLREVFK